VSNSSGVSPGDDSPPSRDSDDNACTGDARFISSLSAIFFSESEAGDVEGAIEDSGVCLTTMLDEIARGGRGGGIGRGVDEATSAERLSGATSALRSTSLSARAVDWLSWLGCWPARIGLFHKRYMLWIAGPFDLLSGEGDGAMFPIDSGSPRWLA